MFVAMLEYKGKQKIQQFSYMLAIASQNMVKSTKYKINRSLTKNCTTHVKKIINLKK